MDLSWMESSKNKNRSGYTGTKDRIEGLNKLNARRKGTGMENILIKKNVKSGLKKKKKPEG